MSLPVHSTTSTRVEQSARNVRPTRSGTANGGGATAGIAHVVAAVTWGSPGKSDAVCPSAPTPVSTTSNFGSLSTSSSAWYSAAAAAPPISPRSRCTCPGGTGTTSSSVSAIIR
ncbi:MAG: hypothetical protein U5K74_11535 [Gemmatimonadaceae bacterium]|nr:hypothetical protein [Gemmatimonadaceae bacterium]